MIFFNSGWFSKGLFKTFLMSKDGRQKWTWMTFFFLNPISYAYSFISWKIMKFVSNSYMFTNVNEIEVWLPSRHKLLSLPVSLSLEREARPKGEQSHSDLQLVKNGHLLLSQQQKNLLVICRQKELVFLVGKVHNKCTFPSASQSGTIFRFTHRTQITHNIILIKAFVLCLLWLYHVNIFPPLHICCYWMTLPSSVLIHSLSRRTGRVDPVSAGFSWAAVYGCGSRISQPSSPGGWWPAGGRAPGSAHSPL